MFKLIFYIFFFYLAFKIYKYFKRVFFTPKRSGTSDVHGAKKNNIRISSEDIIDAEFEDIDETKTKDEEK